VQTVLLALVIGVATWLARGSTSGGIRSA
jgi:hypothetical protein